MADQKLARYSALLSGSELFLGSLVHGIKIPLGGHALSLIQLGLLSQLEQVTRSSPDTLFFPWLSSNIAASLKSLSPVGKKLTPMLAISLQGFLFNLGQCLLGRNLLGALLGSIALALWAFIQPLFFAWIYFGEALTKGVEKIFSEVEGVIPGLSHWLVYAVAALVVIKLLAAMSVVLWVNFSNADAKAKLLERFKKNLLLRARALRVDSPQTQFQKNKFFFSNRISFFLELLRRNFFKKSHVLYALAFSVSLVSLIFVQSSMATKIWWALRPVGTYFAMWLLLKCLPVDEWPKRAEKYFPSFSRGLQATLIELSGSDHKGERSSNSNEIVHNT